MNTKNNQRHQDTIAAIEAVFFSLLKEKELKDISASELCEKAGINRSTFYDNYTDVFSLANACAEKIEIDVSEQLHTDGEFAWIFDYIKTNLDVFEIYFKLGMSKKQPTTKLCFSETACMLLQKCGLRAAVLSLRNGWEKLSRENTEKLLAHNKIARLSKVLTANVSTLLFLLYCTFNFGTTCVEVAFSTSVQVA